MAAVTSSRPPTSSRHQNHSSHHHQAVQNHTSPGSPLAPSPSSTGIPKPTAAVKGTTKTVSDKTSPSSPNVNTGNASKEYHKVVKQSPVPPQRRHGTQQTGNNAIIDHNSIPSDPKGSLPRQKQLGRREDSNSGISVAMVSPMPVHRSNSSLSTSNSQGNVTSSESVSALSEVSHNSGHSNSNSSGGSSVIFKPASSEDDSVNELKGNLKQDLKPLVKKVLLYIVSYLLKF